MSSGGRPNRAIRNQVWRYNMEQLLQFHDLLDIVKGIERLPVVGPEHDEARAA